MIPDRLFTAHLKVFNMANLFDRPMVLLNLPVLVMDFREVVAFKRDLFWQVNHVVATLVFLHRPEQRDLTKETSDQVMTRHLVALNRPVLRCKSSK